MEEDRVNVDALDLEASSRELNQNLVLKDEQGHALLQVALLATVYFPEPSRREAKEAVVACTEAYLRRWGQHLLWALDPDSGDLVRFGEGKASNVREWLPDVPEDESFTLIFHGAPWKRGASVYSLEAFGQQRRPYLKFGYLRVAFPLLEFADGSGSLSEVLLDICRTLQPVSGYGGIGIIESPDRVISSRLEPLVYQWARHFPGLEADYPIPHSLWLTDGREGGRDGIKGGNWLTVLGDRYLPELGGADKVEADLAALDSQFVVRRYDGGVLIQAGPRPQLGDAPRDVWPSLYVKLARYLKPIRVINHNAFQHGGSGERFDKANSEAWLRRFDDK